MSGTGLCLGVDILYSSRKQPHCELLVMQEDVRNIEAGKILLPKYLASAEPVIQSNGVSTQVIKYGWSHLRTCL